MGYNIQTAVEENNKLIVHFEVTNENDTYALSSMAKGTMEALGVQQLKVLADKGYDKGVELKACAEYNIMTDNIKFLRGFNKPSF